MNDLFSIFILTVLLNYHEKEKLYFEKIKIEGE